MSSGKGQYNRLVGKHTQQYCSRAVTRSANDFQKRILFIAAAGADDFVAKLLGVQVVKQKWSIKRKKLDEKITPKVSVLALRTYLSALMVLLAIEKERILQKLALTEEEWLVLWCWVFEYSPEDKSIFDSELLPAYGQKGLEGLLLAAGDRIFASIPLEDDLGKRLTSLKTALINDAATILRVVK
jgi:hypothetical protein